MPGRVVSDRQSPLTPAQPQQPDPGRAQVWEGIPCTQGLVRGLPPGPGLPKDSPMQGGRLTGVSAGPREHRPLRGSRHSSKMSGSEGTTVSDPGTVLCLAAPEVRSHSLHRRMGTVGHPQAWVGVRSQPQTDSSGSHPSSLSWSFLTPVHPTHGA